MIYQYRCKACQKNFDVVKPVEEHRRPENCECGEIARKIFKVQKPIVDKTTPEYYPSLGTVVKSKHHRKELMKEKNLIEVGNEKPKTIHKEMEKTLKQKTNWDDV